jgi:hypothetical protein
MAVTHGYDIDPNQELIAQGMSCGTAGLVGGFSVDGSLSNTSVADSAGQESQMASLLNASLVLMALLFLASILQNLPSATLGCGRNRTPNHPPAGEAPSGRETDQRSSWTPREPDGAVALKHDVARAHLCSSLRCDIDSPEPAHGRERRQRKRLSHRHGRACRHGGTDNASASRQPQNLSLPAGGPVLDCLVTRCPPASMAGTR